MSVVKEGFVQYLGRGTYYRTVSPSRIKKPPLVLIHGGPGSTRNYFEILDPLADMVQFEHVLAAIETGDTSDLFTAGMKKKYGDSMAWINEQNPGGLGAYCQQGFEGCSYDNAKFLLDNNFIKKTDMWGPPPEEFDETVNVIDIISTGVSEIIMGIRPVDEYDQILADWYAAGGQTMVDAVNKYYGG